MASIDIRPDALKAAMASIPAGTPFLMLNLLRFHERARYADGDRGLSGREAYAVYGGHARRHLAEIGAAVVVAGAAHATIIGPEDEEWDQVLLVRYPSIEEFVGMAMNAEYAHIAEHRTAALADSRLVPVVA